MDNGITPGVSYEYRVVAIDTASNTEENLSGDDVSGFPTQSLFGSPKQIREWFVGDDQNQSVAGALIEAWRTEGEGWASTF